MGLSHKLFSITLLFVSLLIVKTVVADVVMMSDGRRFEGKVVKQNSNIVKIDTMIAGIQVVVGLPRSEVKFVIKKPIPAGFYNPQPVAERISDPETDLPPQYDTSLQ